MTPPLHETTVLNPRAAHQAWELSERIRLLGGQVVEAPTIEILPGDTDALDAAVEDLASGAFALVCVTSPNGAAALARSLERVGRDARVFATAPLLAAIGPGTADALWTELRLRPDLLPDASTTATLAEAIPPGEGRALLPRADIATNELNDGLRAKGYDPVEVTAYRTVAPEGFPDGVVDRLVAGEIDVVPFLSSSMVHNFVALTDGAPWQARVVSIGPVTTATCRELGIDVDLEAKIHDLDGVVDALLELAR